MSPRFRFVRTLPLLAMLMLLGPWVPNAAAQATATSGQGLTGRVTDPSGAAMPGVPVVAEHLATGVKLETTTNDSGFFSFPGLVVGRYRLTAAQDGFETLVREGVVVQAGEAPDVLLRLSLGSRTEQVVVTAGVTLDKTTTSTAQALPAEVTEDLPVIANGGTRSPMAFLASFGGISLNVNEQSGRGGDAGLQHSTIFGVGDGGGHGSLTSYKIDGLDQAFDQTQPFGGQFATPRMPAPSAVQQTRVLTNVDAEQGFNLGAVFELITKSGTSNYRGDVYEFARNDALNARNFLSVGDPPRQNQHDFGGTLGGPIPGLGGRHFFFTNYQAFRSTFEQETAILSVPSALMRRGDFSELLGPQVGVDALGRPVLAGQIFDPLTTRAVGTTFVRDPFPGNVIPADRLSSVSLAFLDAYPMPNRAGYENNYTANSLANNTIQDKLYLKTDHLFGNAQRLSFGAEVFFRNGTPGKCGNVIEGRASYEGFGDSINSCATLRAKNKAFRANYSGMLTEHLLLSANAGIAYAPFGQSLVEEGLTAGERAGLRGTYTTGTPIVVLGDTTGFGQNQNQYTGSQWIAPVDVSLTAFNGAHQLKFGFQFNHVVNAPVRQTNSNGTFTFTGAATRQPSFTGTGSFIQPGYALADFMLGVVNSATMTAPWETEAATQQWGLYAQDQWRLGSRLTLNYGLRWELFMPATEPQDRWSNFCPTCPNAAAGGLPGAIEYLGTGPGRNGRRTLMNVYPWAFSPRLGAAYTIDESTVARLYYGVSRYPTNTILKNGIFYPNAGFAQNFNLTTPNAGITPVFADWDQGTFVITPPALDPTAQNGQNVIYHDYEDNKSHPQHAMGASVERELGGSLVVGAKYAGKLLRGLPTANLVTLNQLPLEYLSLGSLLTQNINSAAARAADIPIPYPGFTGTVAQALRPYPQYQNVHKNVAFAKNTDWHALILSAQQRYRGGLSILANYTLQKLLTNDPLPYNGAGVATYGQSTQSTELASEKPIHEMVASMDWGGTRRHTLNVSFSYQVPFGRNRTFGGDWHPIVDGFLGGWQLSGALHYASGTPLVVFASGAATPTLQRWVKRNPDVPVQGTATCDTYDPNDPSSVYVNPAAFSNPSQFELGDTLIVPGLKGCGIKRENVSIFKNFRLPGGDHRSLRIGASASNLFNRHTWNGLGRSLGTAAFGQFANVTPGRAIQLQAQLRF